MKNKSCLLGSILLILFLCSTAHATIWYVHPDSTLNSIQTGLDSCSANDTVLVAAGTYNEYIYWPSTQGIDLVSESGFGTTIIDAGGTARVVTIAVGFDSATKIDGFTIQNGNPTDWGGGIYCCNNSSPIITNNRITGNTASNGAGIYCAYNSSPIITGNTIDNNTTTADGVGGGISIDGFSSPIITDNDISNNTADYGGGIYCWQSFSSLPIISGNTITGNTAYVGIGGGIACIDCSPTITHNIITGNTSGWGAGISCWVGASPIIDHCDISNNIGIGIQCGHGSEPVIHYCDITGNGYGVQNVDPGVTVNAENNWWGDASGPYHPDSNPGGLGDTVSDYVDFVPWLDGPVGVIEEKITPIKSNGFGATIFSGPLLLPEGKKCRVFDITGRVVMPDKIKPGIYFLKIDDQIIQKVIKVR